MDPSILWDAVCTNKHTAEFTTEMLVSTILGCCGAFPPMGPVHDAYLTVLKSLVNLRNEIQLNWNSDVINTRLN